MRSPSWRKDVLLFVGSNILFAASVWLIPFPLDRPIIWVVPVFFGAWAIFFSFALLSGGSQLDPAHPQSAKSGPEALPGPTVLPVARRKAAMAVLFVAAIPGSIFMSDPKPGATHGGPISIALAVILFGWGIAFFAAMLLMPARYGILFDADGLETRKFFLRRRIRWSDTSAFEVRYAYAFVTMVTFVDASRKGGLRGILQKIFAGRVWLSNDFTMPNDSLAWLLNEWRSRALQAQSAPETKVGTPTRPA